MEAALFQKYLEKANKELHLGRFENAQEAIRSASYIQPEHVDVICCQVEIFRAQGHFQEAAQCLQRALKLHPYRPWWVLELADLLINRLQEPGLALDWLGRLMRCTELSSSQKLRAFRLQVEALIDQERLYEASLVLHNALSFFPIDLDLLFLRGWVCLHRSNYYGAASAFHRILRRDPGHADAHYHLGLAFAALGELRLMRCHFEQAYELDRQEEEPPRFARELFEQLVQQSLTPELLAQLPSFQIEIFAYPPPEMLDELGLDPRRPGMLLRPLEGVSCLGHWGSPVLVLFQRNIERFCSSEREVLDEIRGLIRREFIEASENTALFEELLPAISSG